MARDPATMAARVRTVALSKPPAAVMYPRTISFGLTRGGLCGMTPGCTLFGSVLGCTLFEPARGCSFCVAPIKAKLISALKASTAAPAKVSL